MLSRFDFKLIQFPKVVALKKLNKPIKKLNHFTEKIGFKLKAHLESKHGGLSLVWCLTPGLLRYFPAILQ